MESLEADDVAAVWLGRELGTTGVLRPVRVTVLDPRVGSQLELRSSFLQEAAALGKVSHRKLLPVVDAASEGSTAYVVTRHVDAAPLDELLGEARRGGVALTPTALVQIGLDVLDALMAVHAEAGERDGRSLVHGDVTAHSILVTADGVAHLAPTCLGSVECALGPSGTPARLSCKAPEQIQRALRGTPVDARADLFGLGVVLWSAFAGRRLFFGGDGSDLVREILGGSIPHLDDLGRGVPSEIAAVIDRALQKEPSARFESAVAMKAALETAAHSELASAFEKLVGDRVKRRRAKILELFGFGAVPDAASERERDVPLDAPAAARPSSPAAPSAPRPSSPVVPSAPRPSAAVPPPDPPAAPDTSLSAPPPKLSVTPKSPPVAPSIRPIADDDEVPSTPLLEDDIVESVPPPAVSAPVSVAPAKPAPSARPLPPSRPSAPRPPIPSRRPLPPATPVLDDDDIVESIVPAAPPMTAFASGDAVPPPPRALIQAMESLPPAPAPPTAAPVPAVAPDPPGDAKDLAAAPSSERRADDGGDAAPDRVVPRDEKEQREPERPATPEAAPTSRDADAKRPADDETKRPDDDEARASEPDADDSDPDDDEARASEPDADDSDADDEKAAQGPRASAARDRAVVPSEPEPPAPGDWGPRQQVLVVIALVVLAALGALAMSGGSSPEPQKTPTGDAPTR